MTAPDKLPESPRALYDLWDEGSSLNVWRRALAKAQADGNTEHAQVARQILNEAAGDGATPLRALAANVALVKRLTGWRWIAVLDAREQGATWTEIAETLELPDADAARAWYLAKIQLQERYVGDLHDAARARGVLDEPGGER